jgi:hypothetical protein
MMEWILQDHECADPYIDDIIILRTADHHEYFWVYLVM